jgi:SAM-dependent methyltransferase
MPAQDNTAQIAYWNDNAAVTWTTFQEGLDELFQPLTAIALAAAAPAAGETVIDIGCGCGATVLALADRVGPTGKVIGLDISEPMSARARQRIAAANLTNAQVVVSDAAIHTFPPAGADLLFSRFGVMFFADPAAAFANLHRAMRPTGRLLCAAWRPLAENPWFSVPQQAAAALLPPQPPSDPTAPGPFALANHDRTAQVLRDAGWHDVKLTRQDAPMRFAPAGQVQQATDFATRVGALSRMLADQSPETRARVTWPWKRR